MRIGVWGLVSACFLALAADALAGPPARWGGPNDGHARPGAGWYRGYGGPRVGLYFGGAGYWAGGPLTWAWGYGDPHAYPYPYGLAYINPPLVIQASPAPQVWIQQEAAAAAAPEQNAPATSYWYYCTQPAGYYPYVQNCTQPWLKVIPQASGEQASAPRLAP
jgi:hypothetical protein